MINVMRSSALLVTLLFSFALVGCGNAELQECEDKASKLWDPKQNDSKKQKAYWDAIKKCKEKHG